MEKSQVKWGQLNFYTSFICLFGVSEPTQSQREAVASLSPKLYFFLFQKITQTLMLLIGLRFIIQFWYLMYF